MGEPHVTGSMGRAFGLPRGSVIWATRPPRAPVWSGFFAYDFRTFSICRPRPFRFVWRRHAR